MASLNLGIVAHVDAGKTSLTERLLHDAGVIDAVGSVNDGNTQTDTLALERERGITIRAAVVSFPIGDTTVNLIDTPGHPDFIAEVERALSVLDGAVLVISAVEGVQPQTRVLLRALHRLALPTLLFVNKIDRAGARPDLVLADIADRLTPRALALGEVTAPGTRTAGFSPYRARDERFTAAAVELLADRDEGLLARFVHDVPIGDDHIRAALATQSRRGQVHPVFFGSAITGAGVSELTRGIPGLLPLATGDPYDAPSGTVFKVERGRSGERAAYVRMFTGTVRVRDRVAVGGGAEKVTAIEVFERGGADPQDHLGPGQIGRLWGLRRARIGDSLGRAPAGRAHRFPPPTLETVVVPVHPGDRGPLHTALTLLAEQDPLINLRRDEVRQEVSVSLFGEVQKEVIQASLLTEYGVAATFQETTTLCVERPVGTGRATELLQAEANPFGASVGLRIEPGAPGSGLAFRLDVDPRTIPNHLYKNAEGFTQMMREYVGDALREGLRGWPVTDCRVTMTTCGYRVADGPPSMRGPDTVAADFRKLTPLVVMSALRRAATSVNEPVHRYRLEVPADTLGPVLQTLSRLDAAPLAPAEGGAFYHLEGHVPAAQVHELQQRLIGPTRGEALLESAFDHYRPVRGVAPARPRTDDNPLDRKEYLLRVLRPTLGSIR